MYEQHFQFKQPPFSIAPDPAFLYLSEGHREAFAHLLYGFSDGGFVMITGEVGTGKTTLLRHLIKQTPENLDVAFVLNPRLTVQELLETICEELGISKPESSQPTVKDWVDRLTRHLLETHQQGRSTVLIIDEAQNLSPAVLEQIRLLTNLETDQRKLMRIILLGQPELDRMMKRKELRQLAQRITARYHLRKLSKEDSHAYVVHRVTRAGGSAKIFAKGALRRLYHHSKGIPRLINVVADRALLGTYVEGKHRVTASIVDVAAKEVLGSRPPWRLWVPAAIFATCLAGLSVAYLQRDGTEASAVEGAVARGAPATPDVRTRETTARTRQQGGSPDQPRARVRIERPAKPRFDTQRTAFAAVFASWGANYDQAVQTELPCNHAPNVGLQCLTRTDGWTDLLRIGLPAVLELWDDGERPFYGAITAYDGVEFTLEVDGERYRIVPSDLDSVWSGRMVVLWQTPPEYPGILRMGDRHSTVDWLRLRLDPLVDNRIATQPATRFDTTLHKGVLEFQRQSNIIADGVVGPETWIHLGRALKWQQPYLGS